ncbi:MAG: peptidoglycan DD-metalloendopeptidase family protein [Proteobacteria bacterium]|nr:peptidoglycan DD-metalloendopeptidase family protein [Pseudomonadota bacterium]
MIEMKKTGHLFFAVLIGAQICAPTLTRAAPSELAAVQAQLATAEKQNKKLDAAVKESDKTVEKTKTQLVSAADRVTRLESERTAIAKNIADLGARSAILQKETEENRGRLGDAAAGLLAISRGVSFDADNAREYVLTSALLTGVSGQIDADMRAAAAQIAELETVQENKRAQQEKLVASAKKYKTERSELDKLLKTRTAQNQKLRDQQTELQAKLRALSARAKNLAELMSGVGSSALSADTSFSTKKLRAPVSGKLVALFGEKSALGLISDGWRIRASGGALVSAPADGIVKFADNFKGFGRVLILSHKNGYNSVMTGLGSIDVLLGQEVLAGEPVARMPDSNAIRTAAADQNTGWFSSGPKPEMYLEIRRGANAVDPARLFSEPS